MRGLEKNRMGRGPTHTHTHTHRRTCQLCDQLGPEGRVGENIKTRWRASHSEYVFEMLENLEKNVDKNILTALTCVIV